jgi:hypothetical protein
MQSHPLTRNICYFQRGLYSFEAGCAMAMFAVPDPYYV